MQGWCNISSRAGLESPLRQSMTVFGPMLVLWISWTRWSYLFMLNTRRISCNWISRYQRFTVRYFHRFVGSSLLLYTMSQYSRTWQNSGNWSLEDWSKYSGYCKPCYSHRIGINFTCNLDPRLAELYYCKHSGHHVLLHICRYKDYKLKDVQICHFLDSLPATGMSKDSF